MKMLRLSSTLCLLFFLFTFASVWTVEGGSCSSAGGACGAPGDCNAKCSQYPGGSGSCNYQVQPPLCTCYYDCGPSPAQPSPPTKKCNMGLGPCSYSCRDSCCDAQCRAKFNNGTGYCNTIGSFSLCQCQYTC